MASPFDPSTPLYEGQQPQQAPQHQPVFQGAPAPQQAAGLHILSGVGDIALGLFGLFAGGSKDDEDQEEAEAPRRGVRPRLFGSRPSGRVGKGSCCRRPSR